MSRRLEAAQHVRNRVRGVAGVSATITRGPDTIASAVTIVKLSAERLIQRLGGDFVLEADEHAWLIGEDICSEDLEIGDLIEVAEIQYRVCESQTTSRHYQWWDIERTQKVYITKIWEA